MISEESRDTRDKYTSHQLGNRRKSLPSSTRVHCRSRACHRPRRRRRCIRTPILRPYSIAAGEVISTQKYTHRLRIRQMNLMQNRSRQCSVGCAEVDSEAEFAGLATAHLCHVRGVIVAVEAEIVARDCECCEGVDFVVGAIGWLLINGDGFNDVRTNNIICSRGADSVVGAVQSDSVVWVAGPGQVLEGANYRDDLSVGIWSCKNDSVRPRVISIIAAIGGA